MAVFASLLPLAMLAAAVPPAPGCPAPFATAAGDATYYQPGSIGACSLGSTPSEHVAAINAAQWDGAAHCGECLRVTGPIGSTVVRIIDQCPECASGDVDLSPEAFAAIANPVDGRVTVRWERVACPVVGDVEVKFADGSNRFYVDFLVQNHRYGIASVAFVTEGGQTPIPRESYNRFVFATGIAPPVQLRITATTGQVLEHTFASVDGNDTSIPIGAQFAVCTDSFFRNGFEG